MKVGIFGSKYQVDRQDLIKCLFDALRKRGAEVYVDAPFHSFLTDGLGFKPDVSGLLAGDEFDLDIALSVGGDGTFLRTAARVNRQDIPILGINTGRLGFLADILVTLLLSSITKLSLNTAIWKTEIYGSMT